MSSLITDQEDKKNEKNYQKHTSGQILSNFYGVPAHIERDFKNVVSLNLFLFIASKCKNLMFPI